MSDYAPSDYLDLYNFRQQVSGLYRDRNLSLVRGEDPTAVLTRFRGGRDELFATHPQSALDTFEREAFSGLDYFPYNAAAHVEAVIDTSVETLRLEVTSSGEKVMPMSRVASVHFTLEGKQATLFLYWINVYGGGLFLAFRDTTAPHQSYGGGRYLFDTVKGSDFLPLRERDGRARIVLDFNYAYNPSCAYDNRWECPLAPVENHLGFPVMAGERRFNRSADHS